MHHSRWACKWCITILLEAWSFKCNALLASRACDALPFCRSRLPAEPEWCITHFSESREASDALLVLMHYWHFAIVWWCITHFSESHEASDALLVLMHYWHFAVVRQCQWCITHFSESREASDASMHYLLLWACDALLTVGPPAVFIKLLVVIAISLARWCITNNTSASQVMHHSRWACKWCITILLEALY